MKEGGGGGIVERGEGKPPRLLPPCMNPCTRSDACILALATQY